MGYLLWILNIIISKTLKSHHSLKHIGALYFLYRGSFFIKMNIYSKKNIK